MERGGKNRVCDSTQHKHLIALLASRHDIRRTHSMCARWQLKNASQRNNRVQRRNDFIFCVFSTLCFVYFDQCYCPLAFVFQLSLLLSLTPFSRSSQRNHRHLNWTKRKMKAFFSFFFIQAPNNRMTKVCDHDSACTPDTNNFRIEQ